MDRRLLNRTVELLDRAAFDIKLAHDAAQKAEVSESLRARIRRVKEESSALAREVEKLIEEVSHAS